MEDQENIAQQCDEIEVLKSIYGDDWKTDKDLPNSHSIRLCEGSLCMEITVTLPSQYPVLEPPVLEIFAPTFSRAEVQEINKVLKDVYLNHIGETVLYQWVEKAREWLQKKEISVSKTEDEKSPPRSSIQQERKTTCCINIIHGDIITSKKSIFQGHVAVITSVDEIKQVIAELKSNRKIANATHNMYAYRIYREEANSFTQDCDDDGETQAGSRLLHLLQIMDVRNVLVVVTRWYGGIHLGPDRFRLINNAARQVIERAGLLSLDHKKTNK